jgi:hypothetical protein
VDELLNAVLVVGIYVVLFGLLAWALYFAFGPQVIGLPAMIAVLVIVAGVKTVIPNAGLTGLVATVVGLAAVIVVIGMAMTAGSGPTSRVRGKRPPDAR